MIDILAGRCSVHGWLTEAERKAEYCFRCEEPQDEPEKLCPHGWSDWDECPDCCH